jgi:HEAT repeat protein
MKNPARWMLVAALTASTLACVDKGIVRSTPIRSMTHREIVNGLASPDFRDVLAARAQLDSLGDKEWMMALTMLTDDQSPQKRMLAISELSKRPVSQARDVIRAMADDPDEAVRAQARSVLSRDAPREGGP